MDLAIQGDCNLKYNGDHREQLERYEKDILADRDQIRKIELVVEGEPREDVNEALFDEEDEFLH